MLAAQLCNELKEFFPQNKIEYFVSYYDYYRPEAYLAVSDVFVEKVSAQKLWAIINCDEAVIHTKKWWEDQAFTTQYGDTISCEKEHLKNILDTVKRNEKNGDLEITTQYFSRKQYGRVYPKNGMSLGMLRREIRHYICDDIYYDIDMINAHPTIALGLCEKWGIDCKALESYVNNREDKLNKYSFQ